MSARNLSTIVAAITGGRSRCLHHAQEGLPRACAHGAPEEREYAVEMLTSTMRFGNGVTREVGMDVRNMGGKKALVLTDSTVAKLPACRAVEQALRSADVSFDVWDGVHIEPTDISIQAAIDKARRGAYDSFVAVGGGSTMDTAKCAAIFAANKDADLMEYTTKPFGEGMNPEKPMLPLICVPTTAGTGSEMTTVAIFDLHDKHVKTGIRLRALKSHLAIVDPLNIRSMPRHVRIYSGFDVMCHALESYTALPYTQRARPADPKLRPVYQGSNPISDVWSQHALTIMSKYFMRSIDNVDDMEAHEQMLLAASYAGVGFGNAGVHLCHGLSYPLSGRVRDYVSPDYPTDKPLIPHGLSVCLTAPAVFEFTAPACADRHKRSAQLLSGGAVTADFVGDADAGKVLSDVIRSFMRDLGVPNGIAAVGYDSGDTDALATEALNSLSALSLCPRPVMKEALQSIYDNSITSY